MSVVCPHAHSNKWEIKINFTKYNPKTKFLISRERKSYKTFRYFEEFKSCALQHLPYYFLIQSIDSATCLQWMLSIIMLGLFKYLGFFSVLTTLHKIKLTFSFLSFRLQYFLLLFYFHYIQYCVHLPFSTYKSITIHVFDTVEWMFGIFVEEHSKSNIEMLKNGGKWRNRIMSTIYP